MRRSITKSYIYNTCCQEFVFFVKGCPLESVLKRWTPVVGSGPFLGMVVVVVVVVMVVVVVVMMMMIHNACNIFVTCGRRHWLSSSELTQ